LILSGVSACRGDMGRPPFDHLRVPSTEFEVEAVAVQSSVPYQRVDGEQTGRASHAELAWFGRGSMTV